MSYAGHPNRLAGDQPAPQAADPSAPPAGSKRGLSRRSVLGAAVAGGVGVAAVRLYGGDLSRYFPSLGRVLPGGANPALQAGRGDWMSPLATERARVTQLLRRTGFGIVPGDLDRALGDGFKKTVDRILETPAEPPPAFGDAETFTRLNVNQLQQWWVSHMLTTKTPFAERMTLFWHGHFTSDFRKTNQNPFIYWQNLTWRDMALTNLGSMLKRVTVDPAMLRYLDLSTSTGTAPNENYARELMELFAMGEGQFTEDDVRALARALAGWTDPKPNRQVDIVVDAKNNVTRKYGVFDAPVTGVFDPRRAYKGAAFKFLGKTDSWDTDKALAAILNHASTAPFIVSKVLQHFLMRNPPRALVSRLAAGFTKSRYDVKTLMRDVFMSPEFAAPAAYRSLVKMPTEFTISTVKALGLPADQATKMVVGAGNNLGQTLFDPPDVGGWPNNESWISSTTVLGRVNFASLAVNATKQLPSAAQAHEFFLDGVLSKATADQLNKATDDRTRWLLVLASPEFQLK